VLKEKIKVNLERIIEVCIKICKKAVKKMVLGSGIRDLEKTYSGCQIPDPGVKKHPIPDPGSGSATLNAIIGS
jgi:hypothetical protein